MATASAAVRPPDARTRLLTAALELFARHGYEGTSVRMLCESAEASIGIINYHWGSKEGLWAAVCQHCSEQMQQIVLRSAARHDLLKLEGASGFLGELFDSLADQPELMRIIMWATLEADEIDYAATRATFQPLIAFGGSFVHHWAAEGRSQAVDIELALMSLRSVLIYSLVDQVGHREMFGRSIADPEHRARMRRHFVRTALAILGLPAPIHTINAG